MKQEEKSQKLQKAEEQVRIANARLAEVQKEERQKERDRQNRHKYMIKDKEAPYAQARSYVRSLKIPAYFVTDGILLEGYNYYYETDQFVKMDGIPMYEELCV